MEGKSGQRLLSRLIRVNPRYRSAGTTAAFTMSFESQDLDNIVACSCISATLNRAFPNVYPPISTLVVRWVDGSAVQTTVSVVIPSGQYDVSTLPAAIQTAIQGAAAQFTGITVTYNTTTQRFVFTWDGTGGAVSINMPYYTTSTVDADGSPLSEFAPYIGLMSRLDLLATVATSTSTIPNLSGPDEVYIESEIICSTGTKCVDVPFLGSAIPFVAQIKFNDVPYGFTGHYQSTQAELQALNYRKQGVWSLRTADFRLTDRYGNLLLIPDNCYLDMFLCVYFATNCCAS